MSHSHARLPKCQRQEEIWNNGITTKGARPKVHCLYKSMKQDLELQDGHEYHFPGASDEAGPAKRCQLQAEG